MRPMQVTARQKIWEQLAESSQRLLQTPTRVLVDADNARFADFSARADGFLLDFTRQRLDRQALATLLQLPDACGLRPAIESMWAGDSINSTEGRAVLHVALRQAKGSAIGGTQIEAAVFAERKRMLAFAADVRGGRVVGATGQTFDLVVNIGIGGSDLGPSMAIEALRPYQRSAPRVVCVSNVDGCGLMDLLATAVPARTLFIVVSKTFTTQETMANARAARDWLAQQLGDPAVAAHFVAVSTNAGAMDSFGIQQKYRFSMWDWVGGRYSIWSSVGLALAIAIGEERFLEFLVGAERIDRHFIETEWQKNLPVLLALIGLWNINFLNLPALAVLPYNSRLARFPAYLQQLEMESNGKSVSVAGERLQFATSPIVWGEPANNAQHSFFQMLHQGARVSAIDFLLTAKSSCDRQDLQDLAIANCIAQAEALMRGQNGSELPPYKVHEGNRSVSILLLPELTPASLGGLLALYEHKVFVQSVVWGINAFDQWGVELGKKLCEKLLQAEAAGSVAPGPTADLLVVVDSMKSVPN